MRIDTSKLSFKDDTQWFFTLEEFADGTVEVVTGVRPISGQPFSEPTIWDVSEVLKSEFCSEELAQPIYGVRVHVGMSGVLDYVFPATGHTMRVSMAGKPGCERITPSELAFICATVEKLWELTKCFGTHARGWYQQGEDF